MSIREDKRISYTYYSYEEFEEGRGYIGWRICPKNKTPKSDKYLGSAADKTFIPTAKIILGVYNSYKEAQEAEKYLHDLWDVAKNPHFANIVKAKATSVGFSRAGVKHTEETKQKISEAAKNMHEETKQKLSEAGKGNKNRLGKEHTEETKQKISEANKGKKHRDEAKQKMSVAAKGNKNMLGKKHTDKSKQKMSEASKGKKCYNNGVVSKLFREETDEIPEGFVRGRLSKSK